MTLFSYSIFPAFDPNRYVISGGNDSAIICWKLPENDKSPQKKSKKNKKKKSIDDKVNFKLNHGSKINWLTSSTNSYCNLFVADQTNDIHGYLIQ
jgi:hypothetical protein